MPKLAKPALQDWTLISVRMAGDHASVRAVARANLATARAVSPMRYQALPFVMGAKTLADSDALLFTSPAAIRFALSASAVNRQKYKPTFVIGEGSAKILRKAGFKKVFIAAQPNSKSLLQHSAFLSSNIRRVLVFTAPDGNTDWVERFQAAGVRAHMVYVYARQSRRLKAAEKEVLLLRTTRSVRLISSQSLLNSLWQQADSATREILMKSLWLCSSASIEQALRKLGMRRVVNAGSPQVAKMLDALAVAVQTKCLP
jgi:uroporphyrinogen-III synthase